MLTSNQRVRFRVYGSGAMVLWGVCGILGVSTFRAVAQPAPEDYTTGSPWTGRPGVTEGVAAIMARAAAGSTMVMGRIRAPKPRLVRGTQTPDRNPQSAVLPMSGGSPFLNTTPPGP